jgi:DNA-binding HxlR family transcriptional regulator
MRKISLAECPIRATIKVVGAKWRSLILYHLTLRPHHFGELRRLLGATQKVLTEDLRRLEQEGIVERKVDEQTTPHRVEYSLSPYGETLRPVLALMCEWGNRHRVRIEPLETDDAKRLPGSPDSIDGTSPAEHAAPGHPRQTSL